MKKLLILTLFLLIISLIPSTVLAVVTNPDSVEIEQVNAYRNVIEENDQLYLVVYDITYSGTTPSQPTDETFICRLRANDGSQIGNSTFPYPYNNDGYSYGMIGLYFTAEDVNDLGMNWGEDTGYYISLEGNPLIDWSGSRPIQNKYTFADWYDENSVSYSQTQLTTRLRYLITKIENDWGIDLIEGASGESYLTYYGEEYATHAIENLRVMCPDIFLASLGVPEFNDKDYTTDLFVISDDISLSIYGTNYYSQSFTMTDDYNIQAVKLKGFYTGNPSNLSVDLYESTSGGTPTGTLLSSEIAQPSDLSTYQGGDWFDIVFDTLNYGYEDDEYCIVFSCNSCDSNNYYSLRADNTNGYDNGVAFMSVNSGTTWTTLNSNNDDILFSILSDNSFDRTFQSRMEDRLIDTPFDMTDVAEDWGMSRLWFSSLLCIFLAIAGARYVGKTASPRYVVLTMLLLIVAGGLVGLMSWQFTIIVAGFIPAMLLINNFAFRRT